MLYCLLEKFSGTIRCVSILTLVDCTAVAVGLQPKLCAAITLLNIRFKVALLMNQSLIEIFWTIPTSNPFLGFPVLGEQNFLL